MPALPQFNYLFAIGTIFALLDAFNIGANDVANSFATSVSSKSLTMRQAMVAAGICEFLGAVTVGARVADTIKNGIIPLNAFQGNAGVQMLAFTCAITVSATWLMFCSYMSWPVSTTYSIVSAVAGVGVATAGASEITWGWNNGKGLGAIFAGLIIAPAISAGFGAAIYLLIKFGVLARKNNIRWAMFTSPLFFFLAASVCTMSIIFKGSPSLGLDKLEQAPMAGAIVGTGAVISLLAFLFWVPYVYAKVIKKDYTIRWFHFFYGPFLWSRAPPADAADLAAAVPDYRIVKDDAGNVVAIKPEASTSASLDGSEEEIKLGHATDSKTEPINAEGQRTYPSQLSKDVEQADAHPIDGDWYEPKNFYIIMRHKAVPAIWNRLTFGMKYDIHAAQAGEAGSKEGNRMAAVYAAAKQYPNEVEHTYSFVQVLTACTASFAHGANDVSNAIGPWAAIYQVWNTGEPAASKSPVPIWILIVGALMIVIGLATYGYNIMRVLGNKLTYHSPSRGSSMEMGAALTVILASQYGLPVSTTMCITGSTIGVGLCNGNFGGVNWKAVAWIVSGWVLTIPVVGTLAGCLMGIILNAPHFA